VLASISASYGVSQHQLNRHDKDIETIKMDVDKNEDILIEIRNDVKWLRHKMAEQP
jgi:outer membrane receptor for monomeric catechols